MGSFSQVFLFFFFFFFFFLHFLNFKQKTNGSLKSSLDVLIEEGVFFCSDNY